VQKKKKDLELPEVAVFMFEQKTLATFAPLRFLDFGSTTWCPFLIQSRPAFVTET
jgi:hypothetical protein